MAIEIVASSPKAIELMKEGKRSEGTIVYPFDKLEVGQSFTVPIADGKYQSLHAIASRKGKLQSKKFAIIRHDDLTPPVFEVARIA